MRFKVNNVLSAVLSAATILVSGVLIPPTPASAGSTIVIKTDQPSSNTQAWSRALAKMRDIVAERTNGEVEIKIYPDGVLTNTNLRTTIQMLQSGAIQMGLFLPAFYEQFDPRWQIFSFPFLFSDEKAAYAFCDSDVGQFLLDTLREKNIQGLSIWEQGFRQFTTNGKPLRRPEDMDGMKIRVMPSPTFIAMVKGQGANPTATSLAEVFTSLQQGVVDGQETPISTIFAKRYYEVQDYVTLTNHVWSPWVVAMSAKFFDSLSPDIQKILIEAAQEVKNTERQWVHEAESKMFADMAKMKNKVEIVSLTPDEQRAWKEATRYIHDKFADKIGGREALDRFYEAAGY